MLATPEWQFESSRNAEPRIVVQKDQSRTYRQRRTETTGDSMQETARPTSTADRMGKATRAPGFDKGIDSTSRNTCKDRRH